MVVTPRQREQSWFISRMFSITSTDAYNHVKFNLEAWKGGKWNISALGDIAAIHAKNHTESEQEEEEGERERESQSTEEQEPWKSLLFITS